MSDDNPASLCQFFLCWDCRKELPIAEAQCGGPEREPILYHIVQPGTTGILKVMRCKACVSGR